MNVYDSNLIAALLEARGCRQTREISNADIIIVNTCSVRAGAEDRAYARIASMRHYKKKNPGVTLAVTGCMAQNYGAKIPVDLEHVDYVIGPDNYRELPDLLLPGQQDGPHVLTVRNDAETYKGILAKLDSRVSAYIAVMRGCNKRCAYCIVPRVRGKERSRSPEDIEEEVVKAVSEGIPEITLLGQTVNSYKSKKVDFSGLLRRLNALEGLKRIRFSSPHPRKCSDEFIRTMVECEKVCNHIHLPLQSGSNTVLKKMRRMYTRERYLEIIDRMRDAIPGLGITTDIITGFPGETEEDFESTLSLAREVRYDSAFMFAYSPREGTEAFGYREALTPEEKNLRLRKLIHLQNAITAARIREILGKKVEILLEGPSRQTAKMWVGKTECFKRAVVPFKKSFRPGDLISVYLREKKGNTLVGVPAR
jgi:tRNA-2-methylthio-N6-dimethylallyladenosine synthase